MTIFIYTTVDGYAATDTKAFALLWESSSSCKEVEDKINKAHNKEYGRDWVAGTGNKPHTYSRDQEALGAYIRTRARSLINKGVELTKFSDWYRPVKPRPPKLDIDDLNFQLEAIRQNREACVESLP